ncbi:type III-A CRISPR-associated protein Csm2 [Thomasclavelia cocleata]|uniref:CRISPR system Cms protein Csm2 n=1 Tax=Thomasclavelia cocleata TaxID=69824 RepID=A0A1I0F327_9FIRM|nr:type III-A CRISPR-associated protein Csm2 [Thomasclavelia cocleata]MCR1960675.1 type III-A CRISPR-associated protein Csm2 [Thomasclavelia cocleata]NDO41347.1 type III-A CRISPR-associated protein Csm2 [Thomasclavelia cocleata]PJN81778.1 type III-A CRISPR-associated protein Csm2 [Thomasclavelia cocleata]SET52213.1 CRISPR type III-A/MTUBE-associated protein Csm2 [Thomasclavelia cocleata]
MSDFKQSDKRNNKDKNKFKRCTQQLSKEYNNPEKLYLPNGKACCFAKQFKYISNHQLRKILDSVKLAVRQCDNDFESARKQMFIIVAMSAYNAGRDPKKLTILYNFLESVINENTIKTKADICAFDQLFTSIVAYHKVAERR